MAMTYTSMTPLTSTTLGGTEHTVTGTNLNTAVMVLVKNKPAQIIGTPTGTTLVFRAPPQTSAGAASVRILDATSEITATDQITYSAATAPEPLISQSPAIMRLDINTGTYADPVWLLVRGAQDLNMAIDTTDVDDTDYGSGFWGSDAVVQGKWSITGTAKRGRGAVSNLQDPGQEAIRLGALAPTVPLDIRFFDTTGGPEAIRGFALPKWSPNGGTKPTLRTAAFTLKGQGAPLTIVNPAIADPSLVNF